MDLVDPHMPEMDRPVDGPIGNRCSEKMSRGIGRSHLTSTRMSAYLIWIHQNAIIVHLPDFIA